MGHYSPSGANSRPSVADEISAEHDTEWVDQVRSGDYRSWIDANYDDRG